MGEPGLSRAAELYLDLLERCLTRTLHPERWVVVPHDRLPVARKALLRATRAAARDEHLHFARPTGYSPETRQYGEDWPAEAETMIGLERLRNVRDCVLAAVADGVPGDLIETGVWRGGTTIYMRALLEVLGDADRDVWVADSFAGLPPPDPQRYPRDAGDDHHTFAELAISRADVEDNFRRYGLLDDRVRFLAGWFEDTLPTAPIERLAVLRLDGDMYSSTMQALEALYPKLSPGGFVIVDDYGAIPACRDAVEDFRRAHGIADPVRQVDWTGVYWRREAAS